MDRLCAAARATLRQMLVDWGATPPAADWEEPTVWLPADDTERTLMLHVAMPEATDGSVVNSVRAAREERGADRVVVVLAGKRRVRANRLRAVSDVDTWTEAELTFNVTSHETVPRARALSAEEKAALLRVMNVEEKELPKMLRKDPVCRYHGFRLGQVVCFTRPTELGRNTYYRLVTL